MSKVKSSHEEKTKRKHVSLTILQKIEVLKKLDSGTSVQFLAKSYGISARTVYDIKKQKEKLLNFYMNSDTNVGIAERKTMHKAKSNDLDKVVYEWFKERRSEGVPITGPLLIEKAKDLQKELNIEDKCSFSSGWLTRFKQRHGIRYLKACGEKLSADKDSAEDFIDHFTNYVKEEGLNPETIYNMDETGLFWRSLPRKTLVTADESNPSGVKEDKSRVTVLVCSNAAGTHKCKLLVVGKSAKPRALTGIKFFPVIYRSNKKAWVTRELITEWFENHFIKEARAHCSKVGLPSNSKILLLLDNCAAHPQVLDKENVSTLFLPPNTTSLIQPMDQGIIRTMKSNYKMEILKKIIRLNPSVEMLENHKKMFNMKDCLFLIADAWNSVSQDSLINAWHNLWPASLFIDTEVGDSNFDGFRLNENEAKTADLLNFAKDSFSNSREILEKEEIIKWLNMDDNAPITERVTDADIIANVINQNPENDSSETESDEEEEKINLEQGLSLGEKYINFLLHQDFVSEQEIMTVRRLQQKISKERENALKQAKISFLFKKQNENCK